MLETTYKIKVGHDGPKTPIFCFNRVGYIFEPVSAEQVSWVDKSQWAYTSRAYVIQKISISFASHGFAGKHCCTYVALYIFWPNTNLASVNENMCVREGDVGRLESYNCYLSVSTFCLNPVMTFQAVLVAEPVVVLCISYNAIIWKCC